MADLPNPVTRKEQYLSTLAQNTDLYPDTPITREEQYLDYLCKNGIGGGGTGGTTNYNQLTNRPQINGNTLEGNLTPEDLGLQPGNLVVTLTQSGESITADKSYADINQSYTDGKDIYAVIEGNIVPLYGKAGATYIFQSVLGVQVTDFEVNSENEWSVETINIIANSTRPGGIIADEKTDDDTVEVHVDSKTGKAYVNASQDTPTTTPPIINTASGNPITLTDSSDNLFQGFEMDGKTEQVTTTGAQLLDLRNGKNGTGRGVTYTNRGDGSYTRVGTSTEQAGNVWFIGGYGLDPTNEENVLFTLQPGTYFLRQITLFSNSEGKSGSDAGDIITLESEYKVTGIRNPDQITGTKYNDIIYPMLAKGSTALPWEPYTGNKPSPSPDYPQPIINGGTYDEDTQKWEYQVDVTGKNLLPFGEGYLSVGIPKQTRGRTYILNEDGSINITTQDSSQSTGSIFIFSDSSGSKMLKLNPGTYSASTFCSSNIPIRIQICDKDKNDIRLVMSISETFTINDGEYIKCVWLYDEEGVDWNATIYPQIEPNERTTYEPYKHQSITLTADRPLTKWDKLEKRNGQWGWVYKSEEKQVTQNDSATYSPEGYFNLNNFLQADINKLLETKCNYFIYNQDTSKDDIFWINSDGTGLRIKSSKFEDVDELKLWLSENDVRVLYRTYTETFTPLTPEESAALDALTTYYPTTVISNQQGLNMTVNYISDTKNYIDNKFAELQQSLANTNAQLLGGN